MTRSRRYATLLAANRAVTRSKSRRFFYCPYCGIHHGGGICPSPGEIRRACRKIQATWSDRVEVQRRGLTPPPLHHTTADQVPEETVVYIDAPHAIAYFVPPDKFDSGD